MTLRVRAGGSARNAANQGFIAANLNRSRQSAPRADDGERLTVVWWKDEASLRQWREQERHRVAQRTGRQQWYEWYRMEVATVTRTSSFDRPAIPQPSTGDHTSP